MKDLKISLLLDFYGGILTDKQLDALESYHNEDLSLAEVSEITGISRQGVRDSVKKTENELAELEDKLGLAKRFEDIGNQLELAVIALKKAQSEPDTSNEEIGKAIEIISQINL